MYDSIWKLLPEVIENVQTYMKVRENIYKAH